MVGIIPATIVRGVNAADGNAPRRPVTLWDQAIAAFAADPAALSTACWAGRRVTGSSAPIDRLDGTPYSTFSGAVAIIESDDVIGFRDSSNAFVGLPVFDFNNTGGLRSGTGTGKFSRSWSMATIIVPDVGGNGGIAYGIGTTSGGTVLSNGTLVYMNPKQNDAAILSVPRSRLIDGAPNLIIACADADLRQMALYVNSKTPVVSAAGVGPAIWPDVATGTTDWGFGNLAGSSYNGRAHSFAAFNRSLHHDAASYTKLMRLIDAAAKTFGVALV